MSNAEPPLRRAELLLVLPLFRREVDGHLLYDQQSLDSLYRHFKSFDSLIMAMPLMNEADVSKYPGFVWVPADEVRDRVQFVTVPWVGPVEFLKHYPRMRRTFRRCIDAADRLHFSIGGGGGLFDDWGHVAAEEAIKAGRKFALHADWNNFGVYETQARAATGLKGLPKKLKLTVKAKLTKAWQARLVSHCDLMICNGMEIKKAYEPFCRSPELAFKINDFQIGPDKFLAPEAVEAKCRAALTRPELHVIYAGRAIPMKGPFDWIKAMAEAHRLGAKIKATWLGDGPCLAEMRSEVERLGLGDVIHLPGFVSDRDAVVDALREADVMAFAHLDPESPRVLIESLIAAAPIVGYLRHHPKDLISENEGGIMTPLGDHRALGAVIAELANDRPRLVELIRRASRDGWRFDSDKMDVSRCDKIKEMIRPAFSGKTPEPSGRPH